MQRPPLVWIAVSCWLACDTPKPTPVVPSMPGTVSTTECAPTSENCRCKFCPGGQPPVQEPDPDHDDIPTGADACPDVPEDRDGFEDEDGCPDFDNDGDGVPDAVQAAGGGWDNHDRRVLGKLVLDCRDRPEDADGVEDEDGCPEVLAIERCQLQLPGKVEFQIGHEKILPKSYPVLDAVVAEMQAAPELNIRVENHADGTFRNVYGRRPTRDRAKAVHQYLVDKGIAAERIEAKGFGSDKPIANNATKEGRALNRRTEFWVVGCE